MSKVRCKACGGKFKHKDAEEHLKTCVPTPPEPTVLNFDGWKNRELEDIECIEHGDFPKTTKSGWSHWPGEGY